MGKMRVKRKNLTDKEIATHGRKFKCPHCDDSAFASYESLVNSGVPFCADCNEDMQMTNEEK